MAKKSFQIGLSDLVVKNGDKVTPIAGLKTMGIAVSMGSAQFYSDDMIQDSYSYLESLEVSFDITNLTAEERNILLGNKTVKGAVASSVDDIAPEVSIAFRSLKNNGAYRYVSIPRVKFAEPETSYTTKEDGVEEQVMTVTGVGMPLTDTGIWKIEVDSDATDVDAEYVNTFLEVVPVALPAEAKNK